MHLEIHYLKRVKSFRKVLWWRDLYCLISTVQIYKKQVA